MDTHIQGPVSDAGVTPPQGANVASVVSQRIFRLGVTNANVSDQLCTIEATSDLPILVEIDGYGEVAFTTSPTLVVGNTTTANAYIASGVINPATLGFQAGGATSRFILRARTIITALVAAGVRATGTFTPPTSATATLVINGVSFLSTFNTTATQTVTDLKALIAANTAISALVTTSGTTTLVVTSILGGTQGNYTFTSNAANGASVTGTGTLAGGAAPTTGKLDLIIRATGPGKGNHILSVV